jgi:hypothetical protein
VIYGSHHFSEVSAISQISSEKTFSASVDSQLPSTQNNPYAKVRYFEVTYSDPFQFNMK